MITVYTNPNCMPCRATKRQLDKANAVYQEKLLIDHPDEYDRLKALGFKEFPIVEVHLLDGIDRWSGHRPDMVTAAIAAVA